MRLFISFVAFLFFRVPEITARQKPDGKWSRNGPQAEDTPNQFRRGENITLRSGSSLWELSVAVSPSKSSVCHEGQFFISIGIHGGGSTSGTGDNALLLRGALDCSTAQSDCATDQYQQTLFPLRSPTHPADQSFADNAMTRMPDGTFLF